MTTERPSHDTDSDGQSPHDLKRGPKESSPPPPEPSTETLKDSTAPARMPRKIGQFHVKRVIASGGMGTVYEAVQEHPRRKVAVKVMRQGVTSRSALRRFEYESQILARLRHPGIAQVYEAGTHDDPGAPGEPVPYFAMEYIPNAKPITEYAKEKQLSTRERLEFFAQVCDAVHHGHQKGIIHRDLKPGNILVDPGAPGVKIIDFGVARGTDSDMALTTLQTDVGQLVGTLQYMSPEQCEADPDDLDTRSDVYALGVVLYELLSGRLPYIVSSKRIFDGTRVIREQHPTKLTTIDRALRGDVETIVLKTLEKDRQRRYQSAIELAQDIRRYLSSEAILARPPSILYQLRMFARRNKGAFSAVAAVFTVLVAGIIVSTWQALRATRAERLALRQANIAQAVNEFLNDDLLAAVDPVRTPDREITMREVLDAASKRIEGKFENEPLIEASIRSTVGQTYQGLGLYAAAESHLREAEAIHTRELGEEAPESLRTRSELADLLRRRGWFLQAESLARQTLDIQRRVVGEDDASTAFTLNALGLVLRRQGKYQEAEGVFRQALNGRRRALGKEHTDTLESMYNLGRALSNLGRNDEAETLHRQALQVRRRTLGVEHPHTLASMTELAVVLSRQGKVEEAERTIRETLETRRRVLGDEHPDTLESMYRLAGLLFDQGRLDEAEELFKHTLETRRRVLGAAHLTVASNTDELLRVLRARAKVEEARPYVARAFAEMHESRYEDLHTNPYEISAFAYAWLTYEPVEFRNPVEALSMAKKLVELDGGTPPQLRVLAIGYEQNGRLDDAIKTCRQALAKLGPGESYWRTAFETRLINSLRSKGDLDAADMVLRDALARTQEAHAESRRAGRELVREMMELAVFLVAENRFLQHEWFCNDLAQVRQGSIPQGEPGIAGFVVIYATALVKQEKYAEAEPYLRHCLRIRELALPERDCRIAQVRSVLGASLAGQGKFAEAEPLLLDGYNRMKNKAETIPRQDAGSALADRSGRQMVPECSPYLIHEALERIVNLYNAWGKPDKAAECGAMLPPQGRPASEE
ncbi:MAG: serine/threonine protein kinase [Phycisphaerales bacterium]|nr:MAG: serine/threonine protein kinase [Phycisphaerales bacterium]